MRRLTSIFILLILCSAFTEDDGIEIDKTEAQKAFELLMNIRENPSVYAKTLNLPATVKPAKTQLKWNSILAKVAEEKAYDMAKRNYFSHVTPDGFGINYLLKKAGYSLDKNWTKNKADNYFESMAAGFKTGEEAVLFLIEDKGVPSFGHRKHLLGIDSWNSNLTDIGIGFVRTENRNNDYETYCCIIIAKNKF